MLDEEETQAAVGGSVGGVHRCGKCGSVWEKIAVEFTTIWGRRAATERGPAPGEPALTDTEAAAMAHAYEVAYEKHDGDKPEAEVFAMHAAWAERPERYRVPPKLDDDGFGAPVGVCCHHVTHAADARSSNGSAVIGTELWCGGCGNHWKKAAVNRWVATGGVTPSAPGVVAMHRSHPDLPGGSTHWTREHGHWHGDGPPPRLDRVTVVEALEQIEEAALRAANCPPSAVAAVRLIEEVRLLRAALITLAPTHSLLADDRVLGKR